MTTMLEALKAYIEAQVSSAGKGYPLEVPEGAELPAWAYNLIDDEQVLAHSGGSGFIKARVQLDFMAEGTTSQSDYAIVKSIAAAVRTKLDGYRGTMGGVQIDFCHVTLSDDWADIHKLPVQRFDVMINYRVS